MGSGGARVGAGRKVIPMNEKIAKGTREPSRERIVITSENKPCPPVWLTGPAKKLFRLFCKRLADRGGDTATYTEIIALAACRYAEIQSLSKYLDENGHSVEIKNEKGETTHYKARVEVGDLKDAYRHYHSLLAEMGLTHSSANRTGTLKKDAKAKNAFEDF